MIQQAITTERRRPNEWARAVGSVEGLGAAKQINRKTSAETMELVRMMEHVHRAPLEP